MSQTASQDRQYMPREVGRVQLMQGRVISLFSVFMIRNRVSLLSLVRGSLLLSSIVRKLSKCR